MDTLVLILVTFFGYIAVYHTYGRFLSRKVFKLDRNALVPSREKEDGKDFVPTRRGIIFGHHYASIAGTGPIVGPAIGIIWGWVPALLWIFLGAVIMGGIHDLGALVISLRNQGRTITPYLDITLIDCSDIINGKCIAIKFRLKRSYSKAE
ncbi:MAG: carbon starvation CstA family protein [Candidatus Glassbacteria bacterium]